MAVFGFILDIGMEWFKTFQAILNLILRSQVPLCIWSGYKMFATLGIYKENKLTECLVASYSIFHIITQPPIYGVIVYFFAMSCLYTE